MKWEKVKLGSICQIETGKYDVNHSVDNGLYKFFTCAYGQFLANTYSFDGELILLPGNGANVGEAFYHVGKAEAYQRTYVLSNFKACSKYIYYCFIANWRQSLSNKQYGSATNYIRYDNIASFQIPLPPLAVQERITAILDEADALRKKDAALLQKYDELLQSIFYDMFGDPVKNEKGWEEGIIRNVVTEVSYGTSKPGAEKGKLPYLRMNNITYQGEWDFRSLKYIDLNAKDIEKYVLRPGDLVFNRTNSKELVGKTAVYGDNKEMVIAGYLIRVRFNRERANPYYISGYLNSKHGKLTLQGMCKNIIGMANINAQELQNIKILIPNIDKQNEYEQLFHIIMSQKQTILSQQAQSEALFQSLMQRAFKGELVR